MNSLTSYQDIEAIALQETSVSLSFGAIISMFLLYAIETRDPKGLKELPSVFAVATQPEAGVGSH